MKIIQYKESYSSTILRKTRPFLILMLISIIIIFLAIFVLPFFIVSLRKYEWIDLIVGILILLYAIKKYELANELLESFRGGEKGEKEVLEMLKNTLDDNYTYIANFIIPNTRIGDIDGLLIGPKGVIIIEIKNYKGIFRISGADVFRRLKGDIYQLYKRDPFKQTLRQKEYLNKFFKEKGIDINVIPIIALVTGKIQTIKGETGVFITEDYNLTNHIFKLNSLPNFSNETVEKIIEVLGIKNNL